VVHMIFGGSPARPTRRSEKLIRPEVLNTDVVLSKVVGGSDNLRPQGPSRPRASSWILPTSGSSPIQIQKDPQGLYGWGKRDQRALCVNA
jgi:hypothetical protein